MPGFAYSISDDMVRGVAVHLLQAQIEPQKTNPGKSTKVIPGFAMSSPLRRLAQAKGEYQNERYRSNDGVRSAYCYGAEFKGMLPAPSPEAPDYDCDEFPFRSTYEGAARFKYDGIQYQGDYSVKWVSRIVNQAAGGRLGRWYIEDRILDEDKFFMEVTP